MKKLSFASVACLLLASACVVNADDDDQNTSNNSVSDSNDTNDTDQTTNPSTSNNPTTSDDTTGDESTSDTPTSTTDAETSSGGATTGGVACGWGMLGPDDDVEFGYICGGMGADPDGMFEMECPVDLMAGGDCTEMMITAEGCCDADGDAWYCQDPDGAGPMEPMVVEEPCE